MHTMHFCSDVYHSFKHRDAILSDTRQYTLFFFSDYVCTCMCIQLSVFALSCLYYGPMALQY